MQVEKQQLLTAIRETLQHMKYTSATTGLERTLGIHQLNAIMEALTPVVDLFFEKNLIQSKNLLLGREDEDEEVGEECLDHILHPGPKWEQP